MDAALERLATLAPPQGDGCLHELSHCNLCHGSLEDPGAALERMFARYARDEQRDMELRARPQCSVELVPVPTTDTPVNTTRPHRRWNEYPRYIPTSQYPKYVVVPADSYVKRPSEGYSTTRPADGNYRNTTR